jgi:hypothetical protein
MGIPLPPPGPPDPQRPPKQKVRRPRRERKSIPGSRILAVARSWLGVPYLYGGTTRRGVDCSGLVLNCAQAVGINSCPRTSEEQWAWCEHISADEAGAGDLVFFVGAELDPPPGHVGIVVTPGEMIDAPYTGTVVRYDHFVDGSGENRIIGYGRMQGASKSSSANPYTDTNRGGGGPAAGSAVAGSVVGVIVAICVILLLVVAMVALLGGGLIFSGMRANG